MPFTYEYSQPDEYHFSVDSIDLAKIVAGRLRSNKNAATLKVLDLCAGCGVIGFELSYYLPEIRQFDLVEVQEIYKEHFEKNVKNINRPEVNFRWHLLNYDSLCVPQWEKKFDVIICNPPYFRAGQGKMSPSEFKNRWRFYLDSTLDKLIKTVLHVLSPTGQAYILIRPLHDHGWNLIDELKQALSAPATATKIADVRGTDLILIQKG